MRIKTVSPWNIKEGMLAEIPQFEHDFRANGPKFARVESVSKQRAHFYRGHAWKIRFPKGTWPTESVLLCGRTGSAPAEKWRILTDTPAES